MKSKKSLIGILSVLLVAVIGLTFAYFQTTANFVNVFNTGTYRVVTTEEFVGPENWAPGQEIPKTITSTNEGTIPAAVRVSYTEQWLKEIDGVETDITNQITNGTVIINLDNTSEWIQEGNYYYYKYILNPTKTTSSFIKSVTLNPNMNGASCTQSGLTQICEASNVALGATYKLTITKETVQADKYQDVWNTNVEIQERVVNQWNRFHHFDMDAIDDKDAITTTFDEQWKCWIQENTITDEKQVCNTYTGGVICLERKEWDCGTVVNGECSNTTGYVQTKKTEFESKGATCTLYGTTENDSSLDCRDSNNSAWCSVGKQTAFCHDSELGSWQSDCIIDEGRADCGH